MDEKKALDIEVIDIGEDSIISDYFVICTGTSNTHIKAIADGLLIDGKQEGLIKNHVEGYNQAKWLLIDYGDIVVHIFAKEEREYYDIESLWQKTAAILEQTTEK